ALARIYVGADASPWLRRALDECVGEHGPSTTPLVAGVRARVLQLEGNLAHLAGEGVEARGRYRAAAEDFARAGEGLGRILVEGSLSSLAFEAGDLGEALSLGRRSLRGFLARAQVQTLPAALFNLVRALAAVGAVDEGRRLWRASMELCAAAGEVSALNQARLERVAIDLDAARPPPTAQARQGWRVELGARYARCAASLEAAGVAGEAADAHLRATCMLRAAGRSAASSEHAGAHLDGARRALDAARRLTEDAGGAGELAVRVGVAVESLALAPSIAALVETRRELAELPSPTALVDAGQAQLAWIYDRALLGALHRFGHVGDALSGSVAGRLLNHLESFMNHASKLDRRSLRQSLLSEAGEAQPLRELVRELEAAEASTPAAAEPEAPSEPSAEATGEGEVAPSGAATPRGSTARRPGADRLSHLLRVFRRLSREDQLERLLEQIVEAMMELTDAERGVVCVGRGPARMEVAREMAWEGPQKGEQASAGEGSSVGFSRSVIEQVLASGEPVLSVDAASDDRFDGSRSISHLNLRSVLAVPLIFRGERLGAAYVDHRLRRGNFDAEDLAHMEDFADLAALAVAQARALAEVREQAATLERQRSELTELLASREAEVVNLREVVRSAPERREYRGMVGSSKAMQRVFRLIDRLASSEVPVVIYGESGTGKELVARAIHDAGIRAGEAFIAENCGAIPETLLESVLFGHARGAFTGAQGTRPGLFEAANGGTIFLDEIGETSAAMQTKLLRVLQEGEVRRLGENRSRKVDVRVIAASNRDLEAMVAAGTFRQDLYYRINVVKLELPALRERREDIPALIEHFLVRHGERVRARRGEAADGELPLQVTASALRKLSAYPWPGNVRELENEVQRWLALCEDKVVVEDLSAAIEGSAVGVDDPDDLELRPRIERLERELIDRAMKRTNNNQTQAAKLLGLSRYGLQKKLKRFEESE
ncbi:transcriptional regulator, NifA subfamily, Fis Family, partial [Plesiocystis pacifica SIR-1]